MKSGAFSSFKKCFRLGSNEAVETGSFPKAVENCLKYSLKEGRQKKESLRDYPPDSIAENPT